MVYIITMGRPSEWSAVTYIALVTKLTGLRIKEPIQARRRSGVLGERGRRWQRASWPMQRVLKAVRSSKPDLPLNAAQAYHGG
jgi:hypothetical protein